MAEDTRHQRRADAEAKRRGCEPTRRGSSTSQQRGAGPGAAWSCVGSLALKSYALRRRLRLLCRVRYGYVVADLGSDGGVPGPTTDMSGPVRPNSRTEQNRTAVLVGPRAPAGSRARRGSPDSEGCDGNEAVERRLQRPTSNASALHGLVSAHTKIYLAEALYSVGAYQKCTPSVQIEYTKLKHPIEIKLQLHSDFVTPALNSSPLLSSTEQWRRLTGARPLAA